MLHYIYSATPNLPVTAPASPPWRFDIVSALIGAVVALLLAGLVYHFRKAIRQSWEDRVATPLAELLQRLQASAGDQYCGLVCQWARSRTVLASMAPFDVVFVEPRLLAPVSPTHSATGEESDTPFTDSQAVPLRRILGNHHLLTVSGAPGAGVSTLLAYVALTSARAVAANAEVQETLGPDGKRLPFFVMLSSMNWEEDEPDIEPESQDEDNDEIESPLPSPVDKDEGEPAGESEDQNENGEESNGPLG